MRIASRRLPTRQRLMGGVRRRSSVFVPVAGLAVTDLDDVLTGLDQRPRPAAKLTVSPTTVGVSDHDTVRPCV